MLTKTKYTPQKKMYKFKIKNSELKFDRNRQMKYHIEKNTVQETLVIRVYGRKTCTELFPSLYKDETAAKLINQIDYDFSSLEEKSKSSMQQFGFLAKVGDCL